MFSSLKSKIIFFLFLSMAVTAAAVLYFTHKDVGRAMYEAEEASARNVLSLVELTIRGGYDKLLADRIDTLQNRKQRLKSLSAMVVSVLDEFALLVESGRISADEAQKNALKWMNNVAIENGHIFAVNPAGTVLSHSSSGAVGSSIQSLRDMKGRGLADVMCGDALKADGDYAVFEWKLAEGDSSGKKLGYFVPFTKWRWSIGAVADIGDIEAEAQKKLDKIIEVLRISFESITVAKTGTPFIVSGEKKIVIPLRDHQDIDWQSVQNTLTGNRLLDDLMRTAKAGHSSIRYANPEIGNGKLTEAFVSYFKPLDWFLIIAVPVDEIQAPATALVTRQSLIIAVIFAISLIAAIFMVASLSRPLNLLAAYAKELPLQDFTSARVLSSPIDELPQKYRDEVGRLAESFIYMRVELKKNIHGLMDAIAARQRLESELNVARDIQLGILPKIYPAFPEHKEFALFALLEPAKEVGGDLYDYFFIDEDNLCFTIGDVSGKGVPAALFMTITMTLVKTSAKKGMSPADMMHQINNSLSADNPNSMFVTLLIGIFNIRTGLLQYVNAGHNPPIVVSRKDGVYYKRDISGPIAGIMEGFQFKEIQLQLDHRDALFLYTDGITEAMNTENQLFSEARLLKELEAHRDEPVEDFIVRINEAVTLHAGEAPQSDDITMLFIRYM
ncbi:MAG: SpoIIE family protein phosphatase [Pseudomonadota bacterium]